MDPRRRVNRLVKMPTACFGPVRGAGGRAAPPRGARRGGGGGGGEAGGGGGGGALFVSEMLGDVFQTAGRGASWIGQRGHEMEDADLRGPPGGGGGGGGGLSAQLPSCRIMPRHAFALMRLFRSVRSSWM